MRFFFKLLLVQLLLLSEFAHVYAVSLRIVGGTEAPPHSAPYIVTLITENVNGSLEPFCGGSILNENWILTAAHCLELEPSGIIAMAGHHFLRDFDENIHQVRKGDLVYRHPEFKGIGPNDIGLLHVSPPFVLSATAAVRPVKLADRLLASNDVMIQRWGSIWPIMEGERHYAEALQRANLTLTSVEKCQLYYPVHVDVESNFCSEFKGRSACIGDSGGPVIQADGTQIGIIAWGPTTCEHTIGPSVFTKIPFYRKWINDTIFKLTNEVLLENTNVNKN